MKNSKKFYAEIFEIMGDLTPLSGDCGKLCGAACCKGDENLGMRLFPFEESNLRVKSAEGGTLAVCNGKCKRSERPLSCRIFPFFPALDKTGRVSAVLDSRAFRICPLLENCDKIRFNKDFLRAVRRVGRRLEKDSECRRFMTDTAAEIEQLNSLLGKDFKIPKRK